MDAAIPSWREQHPKKQLCIPHFYTTFEKPIYIYIYFNFLNREIFTQNRTRFSLNLFVCHGRFTKKNI
jgi:hypothetical protein